MAVQFTDGSVMALHFFVIADSLLGHVDRFGAFMASTVFLDKDFPDPFNRGASLVPWDREDKVHVLQDGRTFIVGLSDDAGGGNHLGFATKNNYAPTQTGIDCIDDYIELTLMGKKNGTFMAQPSFSLQQPDDRILMTVPRPDDTRKKKKRKEK